jgi:hypothetical protein
MTGTGDVVMSTSPTLVTPDLGTPTSGNLANCTFPTFNQDTTGTAAKANALNSATTIINVSSSPAPSAGQVLTAQSGTAATWAAPTGGSLIYLSTVTASNAATADIETTFNSTYDNYVIVACDVKLLTATTSLRCYPKLGGTYTADSAWKQHGSTAVFSSTASYLQTSVIGTGAFTDIVDSQNSSENNRRLEFVMEVMGPVSSATVGKGIIYRGTYRNGVTSGYSFVGGSMFATDNFNCTALTGIRFQASSGNISGTFRLYGIKNS